MSTVPVNPPLDIFTQAILPIIQDRQNWVTSDVPRFVLQTILQRYSKDAPLVVVSDVAGNGTNLVPLPVVAVSEGQPASPVVFDPDLSAVLNIEYPIGQIPEQDFDGRDWSVYQSPTGFQLQVLYCRPQIGELMRVTWTAPHAPDGSTVRARDFYAVCDYAASLALQAMAGRATQVGDNTMGADTVNYRTKAQEYLTLAAQKRKLYFAHFGISETSTETENGPAFAMGDMKNIMGSGIDRLIHGRNTR